MSEKRQWTPSQKKAIDSRNGNFLVSAGAGSGKTAVLTERITDIVSQGIEEDKNGVPLEKRQGARVSELLVLTFTNKAAGEMKSRIRDSLIKAGCGEAALGELETADITTFDSYFLSLVKRYHNELGIDGDVAIGEGPLMEYRKRLILDAIFDELYEKEDKDFLSFVDRFAGKEDSDLKKAVLSVYQSSLNERDPASFIASLGDDAFYGEEYVNRLRALYIEENRRTCEALLEFFDALMETPTYEAMESYRKAIEDAKASDDPDALWELASKHPKLPPLSRGDDGLGLKKRKEGMEDGPDVVSEEEAGRYDGLRKEYEKMMAPIAAFGPFDEIISNREKTRPYAKTLSYIAGELRKRFMEYKKGLNLYEFADIAAFARGLLKNPKIKETLRKAYKYVMVDEYQDTNDLQESFLSDIVSDNLFAVGDVKQSIYRFRNADLHIFLGKYKRYEKGDGGTLIVLNRNFRSSKNVIDDVNAFFSLIMTDKRGGIAYDENQKLNFGNEEAYGPSSAPEYLTSMLEYGRGETTEDEAEAKAVAADILSRIARKEELKKEKRPISYGDFAILARGKGQFHVWRRVFKGLSIPLVISAPVDLSGEDVSLVFKSFLRLYLSYGVPDKEAEEKRAYLSIRRSYLYRDDDGPLFFSVKDGSYRSSDFYRSFRKAKDILSRVSLSEATDLIISSNHFIDRLPSLGDVAPNYEELLSFRDWAETGDRMGLSLKEFAEAILSFEKKEIDFSVDIPASSEGAVRLMSIHASKGLEFPIVYLIGSHKKLNLGSSKEPIIADREYGPVFRIVDSLGDRKEEPNRKTLMKYLLDKREKREGLSEEARLLYVAWTRAGQRLIITKSTTAKSPKHSYASFYKEADDVCGRFQILSAAEPTPLSSSDSSPAPSFDIERRSISARVTRVRHSRPSKDSLGPMDYGKLAYGTDMHRLLELVSFKNHDASFLPKGPERARIERILSLPHFQDLSSAKEYHEYSFYDSASGMRGSIDLLFAFPDHMEVVDFKSSKTDDEAYDKQLASYADYIAGVFGLPVRTYLLSLHDGTLEERFSLTKN